MTLVADFNSSVSVPFQRMRMLLFEQGGGIQEGVVGAGDLKVIQRGAGANMSVDVPAGAAWVQIDTGTRNGLGHVYNDATANVTVSASNGTNPRIDQIILRWNDSSIPTGSGNVPTLEVLTGTATSGATLDNRTGATALPADCLRLADILVPAASSSVTTANIRDRRPWAKGAHRKILRNDGGAAYTTTSTSFVDVDATNLRPRIECSGAPLKIQAAVAASHSVSAGYFIVGFAIDGTLVDSAVSASIWEFAANTGTPTMRYTPSWEVTPTAGSHLISLQFGVVTAGTLTVIHTAAAPILFTLEEVVRQDADNT